MNTTIRFASLLAYCFCLWSCKKFLFKAEVTTLNSLEHKNVTTQSPSVRNLAPIQTVAWVIWCRFMAFSKIVAIFLLQGQLMCHLGCTSGDISQVHLI